MKNKVTIISLLIFFVACGSNSGNGTGSDAIAEVKTTHSLGECNGANEGVAKLVTSEDAYYICSNGIWNIEGISDANSKKASFGQTEKNEIQSSSAVSNEFVNSSRSSAAKNESSSSFIYSSESKEVCDGSVYDAASKTLKDCRDGKVYRTVQIGEQIWMAENLNYRYLGSTADEDSSSFCYNGAPANCDIYGRLYFWSAAMDSAGIIEGSTVEDCGNGSKSCDFKGMRGVCPQGWLLPGRDAMETLIKTMGGESIAGYNLKSTTGWSHKGSGSDKYGFSALPAGYRVEDGHYAYEGEYTRFWTSYHNQYSPQGAYNMFLKYTDDIVHFSDVGGGRRNGFSVRCIKD